MELGLVGGQQGVDEILVLRLGHRAVDIGALLFFGIALVITGLLPSDAHIDAVGIDDGRDGIEKGQRVLPGLGGNGLRQRARGQGARRDDRAGIW